MTRVEHKTSHVEVHPRVSLKDIHVPIPEPRSVLLPPTLTFPCSVVFSFGGFWFFWSFIESFCILSILIANICFWLLSLFFAFSLTHFLSFLGYESLRFDYSATEIILTSFWLHFTDFVFVIL